MLSADGWPIAGSARLLPRRPFLGSVAILQVSDIEISTADSIVQGRSSRSKWRQIQVVVTPLLALPVIHIQSCRRIDFLRTGTRLFLISYDAGAAALLLAATALLASLIPALRAALVGPATVLRQE